VHLQDLFHLQKPKVELTRLGPKSQRALDSLMDKKNGGELTPEDKTQFKALLGEVHKIGLSNAKALVSQKRLRESTPGEVLTAR
jgi:hypothetical protein